MRYSIFIRHSNAVAEQKKFIVLVKVFCMTDFLRLGQSCILRVIFTNILTNKRLSAMVALVAALVCATATNAPAQTPTPVLTWRYDNTHAGQNTTETALTLSNVNVNTFGKLFSLAVDSTVYPQPLYVPNLKMGDGLQHNVLFVATSNDSVYAFDADSNGGTNASPLWQISLLSAAHGAGAGATAIPYADTGSPDVAPTIGITGTPAINAATNTMYLVAATKENGQYFSRLHAINILTGAEQPNSPVNITATVAGTGNGSSGGQLAFSPLWENQRTALNYFNGYVYFGYAAHGDLGPWHGWLFSYNATTMAQTAVLCLSPNGYGAGLWGSGAGMPIDQTATGGRMFVSTGNGSQTSYPPFSANTELSESIVSFNIANGQLTPIDAFTTYNFQALNNGDLDQGSGGVLMVADQQGTHPHVLVTAGKEGRILVLNRDSLGGNLRGTASNTTALQDISNVIPTGVGFWSTPAYWNGHVYLWAEKNVPMMFDMNTGVMSTTPTSKSPVTAQFPDPSFSVSSNGTQDGIAWAVRSDQFGPGGGPAVLYAWNATDLTSTIYESDTNSTRDAAGRANKFSIPVVTNGKVYVATEGEVDVYGLLDGATSAEPPVITPNGGTFSTPQTVTMSSPTSTAEIFYTLDGTTPSPASTPYTGPITVNTDTTINAIASAAGFVQSAASTATFTFTTQTAAPTFAPSAGTYINAQTVTISDTDASAKIYYTTDGTTPSAASTPYTGPIAVAASETINAIAIDAGLQNSNVSKAAYVIQNGGTTINFGNGFASTAGLTLNGSTKASNDTRLQLTDGGVNEASSVFWNVPINIQAFTTTFEFQLSNAVNGGNGFTFTIQNNGPTALGGSSAGLGYQDILKSVAVKFNFYNYMNEGNDSTGVYINGQAPVNPSVDISSSGIQLNSDDGIQATISYDGTTLMLTLHDLVTNDVFTSSQAINIPATIGSNTAYVGFTGGSGGLSSSQKLLNWTYATQSVLPTFTPPGGSYAAAQNVTLSSATAGAKIYYTTDKSTPTAKSMLYTAPIAVATTETINAIAISSVLGISNVANADYTIEGTTGGGGGTFALAGTAPAGFVAGNSATSTITVTPSGGFTGLVALSCSVANSPAGATNLPTCSVSQPPSIASTQAVTSTLTVNTAAATTAGGYTVNVVGTAGTVTQTAHVALTITAPPPPNPNFALTNTAVSIASPGTSGTSTITVTPSGGFTGSVALSCAVTSSPSGATDVPTCSLTQPGAISGAQAVTGTLTVNTTAATAALLHKPLERMLTLGGSGTLAALLLFCVPFRRRAWPTLLGLLVLVALITVSTGCGGSSSTSTGPSNPGTTAGSYSVTVTGTSGATTATTVVAVTVK